MKYLNKYCSLLIVSSLICLLATGCKDKSTEPDPEDDKQEEIKNPNQPNATQLIISEQIYGEPNQGNTIWDMDLSELDGFYFSGVKDNNRGIGLLDGQGNHDWFHVTSYVPIDVQSVQPDIFRGMLVVGAQDTNDDDLFDRGFASLIHSTGTIRDQITIDDTSGDTWLRAAVPLSDSIIVVVGGGRILGNEYPLLGLIYITPDTLLREGETIVIQDLPENVFNDIIIDIDQTDPASTIICYASGLKQENSMETITLHKITVPIDSVKTLEIAWSRDIVAFAGMETRTSSGNNLALVGDNLYIAGRTETDKDPAPAGDGYWAAGLAASVSKSGTINWIQPVLLSEYSDLFYCLHTTDDALYAFGEYSTFYNRPTERSFGYGLITKFDLNSGDIIANLSFGNDQYESGFNTGVIDGTTAYTVGWTNYRESSGGWQSWFVEIDLSGSLPDQLILTTSKNVDKFSGVSHNRNLFRGSRTCERQK